MIGGWQCIYPINHHGEHYAPGDGRDHSDEIRVKVLSDALNEARVGVERKIVEAVDAERTAILETVKSYMFRSPESKWEADCNDAFEKVLAGIRARGVK